MQSHEAAWGHVPGGISSSDHFPNFVWTALCHPLLSKPYPSSSHFVQLNPCSKQTMFSGHRTKTVGIIALQCPSASQNLTRAWLWDVPSSQYKHRKRAISIISVHFACHFSGNFSADCIWDGTQPQKDGQDSAWKPLAHKPLLLSQSTWLRLSLTSPCGWIFPNFSSSSSPSCSSSLKNSLVFLEFVPASADWQYFQTESNFSEC